MTETRPQLWIVAGPNGVGKTTYAFRYIRAVSGSTSFVNLDEIARGLSPLDPSGEQRRSARVALDLTRSLIAEHRSFSLETTLSGRTHLMTIAAARRAFDATDWSTNHAFRHRCLQQLQDGHLILQQLQVSLLLLVQV